MGKAGNGVFRVLSIDGGGMRGLYTTKLLSKLFQLFNSQSNIVNVDFGKSFDLICGTSTGAILACALAAGIPLKTITSFYTDVGPRVFSRPKPISKLQSIVWVMNHLLKPSADSEILREGLVSAIGDLTLREVYENRRIGLCIPCVNAITQKA
ncbi:MAG: patatin-like phospholipase family protein, partial [Planctomycetes bacterium]|nr:patatin-like phospholipase family protein [Planctomycetota bacterium]